MEYVLYRYGTQAQFDSIVSKESNALYFIEDTHRLYKGSTLIASDNVTFVTTAPEFASAEENRLYIVYNENGYTMYVKGDSAMDEVGGSIKAGDISDITAFADSILTKSDGILSANDDSTIPTSGAVKAAIETALSDYDGALVDVTAARAEDNSGTLLTFTAKDGTEKSITVSDLFLTSASYNSDTHILSLSVKGQKDPVQVDLSQLVPQAVNASQVAIAREITVTTNVGNLKAGDKVILSGDPTTGEVKASDVQALFEAILSKDINPSAVQPSVSVSLTGAGAKEVGTSFTPSYRVTLNPGKYTVSGQSDQASGVTATAYSVTDTNSGSSTSATGSFDTFTVEDDTQYSVSATVTYGDGDIPKTFLGNDYADAQIKAGSKSSTSSKVTGFRNCYWGYKNGTNALADPTAITAAQIKALGKSNANKPSTIDTAQMQQMFFAIPAGKVSGLEVVSKSTNLPQTVQPKLTVQIGGVNDYSPIAYDVYYVANAVAEAGSDTYSLTWK
jgi:hypothetical protein